MAFRDPNTVLRQELDAARARIETLEKRNAELGQRHSPMVRALMLALGVVVVLAAGLCWHVLMQNRGLSLTSREQDGQIHALRNELDHAIESRASAESAVVAAEASCRERTDLEVSQARRQAIETLSAGPSPPPTPSSPTRYFWVGSATGRSDVRVGDPCAFTVRARPEGGGRLSCAIELTCGLDEDVTVISQRTLDCHGRTDGWVNVDDDDGSIRLAVRGPQIGVRDEQSSWQLMLANERPCR